MVIYAVHDGGDIAEKKHITRVNETQFLNILKKSWLKTTIIETTVINVPCINLWGLFDKKAIFFPFTLRIKHYRKCRLIVAITCRCIFFYINDAKQPKICLLVWFYVLFQEEFVLVAMVNVHGTFQFIKNWWFEIDADKINDWYYS